MIQNLRSNRFVDEEQLDILNDIGTCYTELLKRKVEKGKKKSSSIRYTPKLRSFALTLHYYSTRAYEYVRKTFDTCLPHPRTISRWYNGIDGEPGISEEALKAIKLRVESCDYKS